MTREELLRIFDPSRCTFDLRATGKDAALREILGLVAPEGSPHHHALVDMLHKREAYGTTAAIKGVALPHGRSLAVNRLTGIFARSRQGVAFGAADVPRRMCFSYCCRRRTTARIRICRHWAASSRSCKTMSCEMACSPSIVSRNSRR